MISRIMAMGCYTCTYLAQTSRLSSTTREILSLQDLWKCIVLRKRPLF